MKYIRTYDTEEKFLTDKDSTSRGFRLKSTLYKYSEVGDHVQLELDDPRKHGDSTYMEITLDSDAEFSFYIGNKSGDSQTTMNCSIDWGDGTVETKTVDVDDNGFKLSHNYKAGSYKIELYDVERDYSIPGDTTNYISYISPLHSSVKRIVLGNNVTDIGESAFNECESLISVYIPESVTSIGNLAFIGCISLTSVHIPESVTTIGEYAFGSCKSLTSVHIPNSVISIGASAFDKCESLTSVYIPEGVTSIGGYAFEFCDSLTSIYIPEGVTSIGEYAFSRCPALISAYISSSGNSIGRGVFYMEDHTTLTSVYISEGVTSIGILAFRGCSALTSIHIPESVTSIEWGAFEFCSSLTSIHIPEGVTSIGNWTFEFCTSLTSISIPERVTTIGEKAFKGCSALASISSFNTTAPTLSTTDSDNDSESVFHNLPTNGTLHIKPSATGYDAWLSQLPSGWTIVEDL